MVVVVVVVRVWERGGRGRVASQECKQSRKLLLELPVSAVTLFLHFTTSSALVCARHTCKQFTVDGVAASAVQSTYELVNYRDGGQVYAHI